MTGPRKAIVNRLVDVASARYFGTPSPPQLTAKPTGAREKIFSYLTSHRDDSETRLRKWCSFTSRTTDIVGRQQVTREIGKVMKDILMSPVEDFTNDRVVWAWESRAGMENGTLLVCQLDVPFDLSAANQGFRRDPEWGVGEGFGSVWAPLTML